MTTHELKFLGGIPECYITKTVTFRYRKQELSFFLSLSLFSSNDVDSGSRLLLKSLSEQDDLESRKQILDIGSGAGVLGISLGKTIPDSSVSFMDRDALAAAFTGENCRGNGVDPETVLAGYELPEQPGGYDLIVSNVPAKAGERGIRSFIRRSCEQLASGGLCGWVIVEPLSAWFKLEILQAGCEITYEEHTKKYSVYHSILLNAPEKGSAEQDPLSPFLRGTHPFSMGGEQFTLTTCHNVPNFDSPGYEMICCTQLFPQFMKTDTQQPGSMLFINPGQGHLAVLAALKGWNSGIILTSRDTAALETATRNIQKHCPDIPLESRILPYPRGAAEKIGNISKAVISPDLVSGIDEAPEYNALLAKIIAPSGLILISGKINRTLMFRKKLSGFNQIASRKKNGYIALLLRKN